MHPHILTKLNVWYLKKMESCEAECIGPIPKFKFAKASYDSTFFCQTKHGLECNPNVNVLVGFLHDLNHPSFQSIFFFFYGRNGITVE